MMFRNALLATSAALTLAAAPAYAQQTTASQATPAAGAPAAGAPAAAASAQGGVAVGATVKDTNGGEVGRITAVEGANAVLDTGINKVSIPLTSFATGPSGPILGMTKVQVDQAASGAQQHAQANAETSARQAVTQGATVRDAQGGEVGTIKSVDAEFALIDTTKNEVRLPLSAFAAGPNGPVIGMTRAQLDAAAEAATPAGGAAAGAAGEQPNGR